MSALAKLRAQVPEVIAEYFTKLRDAECNRDHETKAVITIQRVARGFITRRRIDRLRNVVTTIQRCWRGYLGRQRYILARETYDKRVRQAYFDATATLIQRHWRGFWSRKYLFNFYARQKYLQRTHAKNEQMRAELHDEAQRALHTQRQMAEEAARQLFDSKVGKLHHLISTGSQPGIFNSPFSAATGTLPMVAGMLVEDHLKANFKSQLSSRLPPLKKSPPKASPYPKEIMFHAQKMHPRITLRQCVNYDFVHQAALLEEKIQRSEMLNKHPHAFISNTRSLVKPPIDPQSNRNMEPYFTPFDPTIGIRNETFTPSQRRMSSKQFAKYCKVQGMFEN